MFDIFKRRDLIEPLKEICKTTKREAIKLRVSGARNWTYSGLLREYGRARSDKNAGNAGDLMLKNIKQEAGLDEKVEEGLIETRRIAVEKGYINKGVWTDRGLLAFLGRQISIDESSKSPED